MLKKLFFCYFNPGCLFPQPFQWPMTMRTKPPMTKEKLNKEYSDTHQETYSNTCVFIKT